MAPLIVLLGNDDDDDDHRARPVQAPELRAAAPHRGAASAGAAGRDEGARAALTERGCPVVTKPLMSSRGRGPYRLTDEASVRVSVREFGPGTEQYHVRPYVPAGARDTGVNYQAMAAVTRVAPEGTWISNVPGNTRHRAELTDDLRAVAEQAVEAMDALFAGVDVARDERTGELRVHEVNSCSTCSATFRELGADPVPLLEFTSFLVAAARDFDRARREWRPSGVY